MTDELHFDRIMPIDTPLLADDENRRGVDDGVAAIEALTRGIKSGELSGRELTNAYADRADVMLSAPGPLKVAIEDYDEAIRLDPTLARAYRGRAESWDRLGEPEKAIADYDAAMQLGLDEPALLRNRGNAWRCKGELDRAIADYDEALRLYPEFVEALVSRADTWLDKGEIERAMADYDASIVIYAPVYINRGNFRRSKGDHDRAVADYDEALRLDPTSGLAFRERAKAYQSKGNLEKALADFKAAFALDPNDKTSRESIRRVEREIEKASRRK